MKKRLSDFSNWCRDARKDGVDFVLKGVLPDFPTPDVQEVKHGYWTIRYEGTYKRAKCYCSVCSKSNGIGGIISNQKKPYCPNCGAKLDLAEDSGADEVTKVVVTASGKIERALLREAIKELGAADMARAMAIAAQRQANKKRTTVENLIEQVARNKILDMFCTMGLTPEELAKDLNTSEENLLNPANWKKPTTIYTAPETGRSYLFDMYHIGEDLVGYEVYEGETNQLIGYYGG